MSMEKISKRKIKKTPSKRIQQLMANDYIDRSRGQNFNDSELHGTPIKQSNNESRDDTTQHTLAHAEQVAAQGQMATP